MAFSTLRKYNVQHGMQPQVAPSKGAAGAPGAASIPSGPSGGSPANDAAALAGMGAVGAGLLGKFAYDKSKDDLMYRAANPLDTIGVASTPVGTDFSAPDAGPNADVLGGLSTPMQGAITDVQGSGVPAPGFMDTMRNVPNVMGNWWDNMFGGGNVQG